MRAFNKRMIYNINLLAIILCCLLFAVYYTAKRAIMVNMLVNHSKEILSSAAKIQFLAAQSGMLARRYLLTGEPTSTKKFAGTQKSLTRNLGQFRMLTAEDLNMRPALDSLTVYIGKRIVLSTEMIHIRQTSGFLPALTYLQSHTGGNYVDEADKYSTLINAIEQKRLAERSNMLTSAQLLRNLALTLTLLFILIIVVILVNNAMQESVVRKNMLTDLIKKDARNKKAEQLAALGTWTMVPETRMLSGSEEMYKIWGMSPNVKAMVYDHFIKHIHPEDQKLIRKKIRLINANNHVHNHMFRLLTGGQVKYINTAITVIRDREGKVKYVSGYVQDITDKKTAELERERMLTALTQRNAALEAFNYMVSHDLRKPVANMIALCELLETEDLPAELQVILNNLQASAASLDETVRGMNSALKIKKTTDPKLQ